MSQGEILMKRKHANAARAQQRETERSDFYSMPNANAAPISINSRDVIRRRIADITPSSSTPTKRAVVDFTTTTTSSPASVPTTFDRNELLVDDADSPPQRRFSPSASSPVRSSQQQQYHASRAPISTSTTSEVTRLTTMLQEYEAVIAKQQDEIRTLDSHLAAAAQASEDKALESKAKTIVACVAAIKAEGYAGVERLRHEIQEEWVRRYPTQERPFPQTPQFSSSSKTASHTDPSSASSKQQRKETEEERMHRALLQSVKQRYLERLRQY